MTKKQDFLRQACESLGLKIELDVKVTALTGESAVAEATVSQANPSLKVYIFGTDPPAAIRKFITDEGSGCSSFGDSGEKSVFDLISYTEMFVEWGFVIYPKGIDCVWLASDRDGCVGVFVTGGEGPIPLSVLQSVYFDIDQIECEVLTLPKTHSSLNLNASDEYKSFIEIAERGFFVFDWRDLHRSKVKCTNAYEMVAIPTIPLMLDSLPDSLSWVASEARFAKISFRETEKLEITALIPCLSPEQ